MGILSNGLVILNVVWYYQWIVRMVVLLIAVGFDRNFGRVGLSKS
jgi:ABC-type xylose transport system permease subunit